MIKKLLVSLPIKWKTMKIKIVGKITLVITIMSVASIKIIPRKIH